MRTLKHGNVRSIVAAWLMLFTPYAALASEDAQSKLKGVVASEFQSTHKQARVIKPMNGEQPVALNTFCLDKDGNILACVGGTSVQYVVNPDGSQAAKTIEAPQQLQFYSAEGLLTRSVDLPFRPTAINLAPDGSIFVAGAGKVTHLNSEGKLLATVDSPHVGDMDSFRERIEEAAKKQQEENSTRYRDQIVLIEERIKTSKEKPEAELTELEKRRLATYEQQKALYELQLKAIETSGNHRAATSEQAINRKLGITAVAVTNKDLFLCTNSIEGTGYEVWRMTHEFSEPVRVVEKLGGCCGQCDIQATDDHLVLAENTKFKVALLDRDGKRLTDFGKGDRKAIDGFGSCCNPMNVRCCDNGDILTAESSIGTIKRFSKTGELLGVVGKARIGGGCKHVAIAFDASRNRYYMMNVDKDHICVLVPNAEAPESTPEELLARAAREGLGRKLVGTWSLDGKSQDEPKTNEDSAKEKVVKVAASVRLRSDPYSSTYLRFEPDGKLISREAATTSDDTGWECLREVGNTLHVSKIQGNIQYYEYKIEFVSDNEATISLLHNDRVMSSNRYKRVTADPEKESTDSSDSDSTKSE